MQPVPGPTPGPAVVFIPVPGSQSKTVDVYQHKRSIQLGIIQIIIGLLCIVFQSVAVGFHLPGYGSSIVSHGIWNGIIFIVSGSMGVAAGKKKTTCKIVAFMVLCIVSSAFTTTLFSFGLLGANMAGYRRNVCKSSSYSDYYPCRNYDEHANQTVIAMESLLVILAIIEAVVAIWGSVICCKAVCCCNTPTFQAVTVNYLHNYPGQIQGEQNPQFMIQMQPVVGQSLPFVPYGQPVVMDQGLAGSDPNPTPPPYYWSDQDQLNVKHGEPQ